MSTSPAPYPIIAVAPPPPSTPFPYSTLDLTPYDTSPDTKFYADPRLVTHISDDAIETLREYYAEVLPRRGRILDLCSSWVSHYPSDIEEAIKASGNGGGRGAEGGEGKLEVVGMGMNEEELRENPLFQGRWGVRDLNVDPRIGGWTGDEEGSVSMLDSTTCTVSIDYLTQPLAVLSSLLARTVPGGTVHLAVSDRFFPEKVVRRWMAVGPGERLKMVADYLHHSGWAEVEICCLTEREYSAEERRRRGLMRQMGLGGDPIWVVRGRKPGAEA